MLRTSKNDFFFSRSNHIKGIKETHNPFALHLSRPEFCFHFAPLFCAMCTNFISINVFFFFAVFSICVLYFVLLVVRTIVQLNINVYTVCTTARYRLKIDDGKGKMHYFNTKKPSWNIYKKIEIKIKITLQKQKKNENRNELLKNATKTDRNLLVTHIHHTYTTNDGFKKYTIYIVAQLKKFFFLLFCFDRKKAFCMNSVIHSSGGNSTYHTI